MGIPVLCLGESGSGKTTSLRNFDPEKVGIFNVASKPLPFRKKLPVYNGATYEIILKTLARPKLKTYVIDDSQALMAFALFSRVKEAGYTKFTEIAVNFYGLLKFIIDKTPSDCIVYFLHHTETNESGKVKAKTVGKMLDNQLTVEGLFSIVLLTRTDGVRHWFETQSDGFSTAKSPMDMFPREIDNDLNIVDAAIREYWELPTVTPAMPDTPDMPPLSPANTQNTTGASDVRF
jgi:hypothetical protein